MLCGKPVPSPQFCDEPKTALKKTKLHPQGREKRERLCHVRKPGGKKKVPEYGLRMPGSLLGSAAPSPPGASALPLGLHKALRVTGVMVCTGGQEAENFQEVVPSVDVKTGSESRSPCVCM